MWILVLFEYYKTSSWWSLIVNFAISGLLCASIWYFSVPASLCKLIEQFVNNSTSVLSLLVGFTVTLFTLLITASNPSIDEIKNLDSNYILYSKNVSVYRILLIRTAYIIVIESLLLLSLLTRL